MEFDINNIIFCYPSFENEKIGIQTWKSNFSKFQKWVKTSEKSKVDDLDESTWNDGLITIFFNSLKSKQTILVLGKKYRLFWKSVC